MKRCDRCGSTQLIEKTVEQIFDIQNQYTLVENIPAIICNQCGEKTFTAEIAETIRHALHGQNQPIRYITMNVFTYSSKSFNVTHDISKTLNIENL